MGWIERWRLGTIRPPGGVHSAGVDDAHSDAASQDLLPGCLGQGGHGMFGHRVQAARDGHPAQDTAHEHYLARSVREMRQAFTHRECGAQDVRFHHFAPLNRITRGKVPLRSLANAGNEHVNAAEPLDGRSNHFADVAS